MSEPPMRDTSASATVAREFALRLDLLESSGQVSRTARDVTVQILAELAGAVRVALTDANAGLMATHLAVALSRLEQGELLAPSPVVAQEAEEHAVERRVARQALLRHEERLGFRVPDSEIDYLTAHLCAVLEKE